jgi:hypothetical protein
MDGLVVSRLGNLMRLAIHLEPDGAVVLIEHTGSMYARACPPWDVHFFVP